MGLNVMVEKRLESRTKTNEVAAILIRHRDFIIMDELLSTSSNDYKLKESSTLTSQLTSDSDSDIEEINIQPSNQMIETSRSFEDYRKIDSNTSTNDSYNYNYPSCSYIRLDQPVDDIEILHQDDTKETIALKLSISNDEYVGVVYKLQNPIPRPNDFNAFIETCRNGDGHIAMKNWPNMVFKQHTNLLSREISKKYTNPALDQKEKIQAHANKSMPYNIPRNLLNQNVDNPKRNFLLVQKDVTEKRHLNPNTNGSTINNTNSNQQMLKLANQAIDDEDEKTTIDKEIVLPNRILSQPKILPYEKGIQVPNSSKFPQNSYNTVGAKVLASNEVDFLSLNPSTSSNKNNPLTSTSLMNSQYTIKQPLFQSINSSQNSRFTMETNTPKTSAIDELLLTKATLPKPVSKIPQLAPATTNPIKEMLDAKKFLALGGVLPNVAKKKILNSDVNATMPQDQFSEADDRSMMDLDVHPIHPIKLPNFNYNKNFQTKHESLEKILSPKISTSPKSISSSVQSLQSTKNASSNEDSFQYKVHRHSEMQLKIVLNTRKNEKSGSTNLRNLSNSPKIGTNSIKSETRLASIKHEKIEPKTAPKTLNLPQQNNSHRMIGKAPTARPATDFKEETTQKVYDTRKNKLNYPNQEETTKNERPHRKSIFEEKPSPKNNQKDIKQEKLLPIEDPVVIPPVDSLPQEKNPNNIQKNDVVWARGFNEPRWPGQVTELFEDGSFRIFWYPSSTQVYNDLKGDKVEKFVTMFAKAFDPKRKQKNYIPAVAEAIKNCLPEREYFQGRLSRSVALCLDKDEGINVDGEKIKEGNRVIIYKSMDYGYDKKPIAISDQNKTPSAKKSYKKGILNSSRNQPLEPIAIKIPENNTPNSNVEKLLKIRKSPRDHKNNSIQSLSDEALAEAADRVDALLGTKPGTSLLHTEENTRQSISSRTSTSKSITPITVDVKLELTEEEKTGMEEDDMSEDMEVDGLSPNNSKRKSRSITFRSKRLRYDDDM